MSDLLVYYQNVNGLRTKLQDLKLNSLVCSYDVICLTETRLNSNVYNIELFSSDYCIYRRDRDLSLFPDKVDGGGCLVAIRKSLRSYRLPAWEVYAEEIWVCIEVKNEKLFINVPYILPNADYASYDLYFENLTKIINIDRSESRFLIVGDFNIPDIAWCLDSNSGSLISAGHLDKTGDTLVDAMHLSGIYQYNKIYNFMNRLLDLVLSNIVHKNISVQAANDVLSIIDRYHPPLEITIRCKRIQFLKEVKQQFYNFSNCNYEVINNDIMNLDWSEEMRTLSTDDSVDFFYNSINFLIKKHIPMFPRRNKSYPVWYSSKLIKLLFHKEYFRVRYKRHGDSEYYRMFSTIRSSVKKEQKACFSKYMQLVEHSICENPKRFWSYCRKTSKTNSIPALMHYNNTSASNTNDICNLFFNFFKSVYSINQGSYNPMNNRLLPPHRCEIVNDLYIDEDETFSELNSIDIKKGCGSDHLPPLFLKKVSHTIQVPLTIIFNKSLSEGKFPKCWKVAKVVPIFKKGDNTDVTNYRPISILNSCSKIFEKIVHKKLFAHTKNIISKNQHGFFKGRSTLTNLLSFTDYVTDNLNSGFGVDVIYTDFSKAFDKVNHSVLLNKLIGYGIQGTNHLWFDSYLTCRVQYVEINGARSNHIVPTSGVPQGSTLGPLLFLLFINDVCNEMKSASLLFADDLKIFGSIKSVNDCLALQHDLDQLSNWCTLNKMELNLDKCIVLKIKSRNFSAAYNYSINNINLHVGASIVDLGITIDHNMDFKLHIRETIKKSFKMLGFVTRLLKNFTSYAPHLAIYAAYVRSQLEYLTPIWNPSYSDSLTTNFGMINNLTPVDFIDMGCCPWHTDVFLQTKFRYTNC